MSQVNSLIAKRLQKSEPSLKMAQMAEKSASGGHSAFNGLFQVTELSAQEKEVLEGILKTHAKKPDGIQKDLSELIALTAEVKAINHQAALLHGERIKKVHSILTAYLDGAFSSWLIATYGNRQTPYNLMQYYNFYQSVSPPIRTTLEKMPRQAVYTLASREGEIEKKIQFVTAYQGETKGQLLIKIRDLFPLKAQDKRRQNLGALAISTLQKVHELLHRKNVRLTEDQKEALKESLAAINSLIMKK